ncbi:hypothetical protein C0Q70_01534 [Pomacea canaliculata]|uniref:G-protein coupled receptors family 1 profile domain-containing protein n=1 Tax=Pomacea canaliculata TaxID=400727 RepID=A0A2T7PZR9_POMCA|nr:hypothetical protein C0Q70_01534 [Pomacea canaliculata]
MIIVLSFAYGLVFIVALAGNLCVVAVVYKDRRFHTPTYVFIVNLALADLSVAIVCLPITLLTNLYNVDAESSALRTLTSQSDKSWSPETNRPVCAAAITGANGNKTWPTVDFTLLPLGERER